MNEKPKQEILAAERALALLQVALDKEQLQPGWAQIDPEFSHIKADPRFQALLQR